MAFCLYDEDGYVGDLASIEGYEMFQELINKSSLPNLQSMTKKGMTLQPAKVNDELNALIKSGTVKENSLRETVLNFQRLMLKEIKKEIVIVSG